MSVHRLMPEWLILARESRGMEPKDLEREAGVAKATLCAIEMGEVEITPNQLRRIASALGLPTSFFLRTDEPTTDVFIPHLACTADEATLAAAEEVHLRARLRCIVRDLSARSLRDAILAIKDIRARELASIEEPAP